MRTPRIPSISTPRLSKKWNGLWIERSKPSSAPGMGENAQRVPSNSVHFVLIWSHFLLASGKNNYITYSSRPKSFLLITPNLVLYLYRRSSEQETAAITSPGEIEERESAQQSQDEETQQDARECQEIYFKVHRYCLDHSAHAKCKKKIYQAHAQPELFSTHRKRSRIIPTLYSMRSSHHRLLLSLLCNTKPLWINENQRGQPHRSQQRKGPESQPNLLNIHSTVNALPTVAQRSCGLSRKPDILDTR